MLRPRRGLSYAPYGRCQLSCCRFSNFVSFEGKPKEYNAEC